MATFSEKFVALLKLIGIDLAFLVLPVAVLILVAAVKKPAFAVLKRNFLAYFTNPTGYVFLCLFVGLSSIAAFWTPDFFAANLANLDQLNRWLPWIMLIFIPTITMSIWADERRQGTDELLLTMPAGDFDIVLGKYLAAVSIFTVSLLFSQIANYLVLINLGDPDTGLIAGNYFGYWVVGLAMLAIGMAASFLTRNLTVGFILGVLFCLPLAFAATAEVILGENLGRSIAQFSIGAKFRDFETGVVSFASLVYFAMIIVAMLYLCMVLIGRRHWSSGKGGSMMGVHFTTRIVALIVIAAALSVFAAHKQLFRWDVTSERLSSLSDDSAKLIEEVKESGDEYVIKIEAFLSADLPDRFVRRRFDLLSALNEIKAQGGEKISLRVHDGIDLYSDDANRAESLYGITKQTVTANVRGATTTRDIIFGVAFQSGLERIVVPFMGASLPIEYELMRSLAMVTQTDKKKLGILTTDANLMGGASPMAPDRGDEPLIEELKKQYEIVQVNPAEPITDKYDVLLAVQPSSLTQPQMDNFIAAVRNGQPTAIFEDPFPIAPTNAPGTDQPKRPPGGMMGMFGQRPEPKGNIAPLWRSLGIKLVTGSDESGTKVIWQDYNPHPEDADLQSEFVWITPHTGAKKPFNEDVPVTSGLQKLLLVYPGGIQDVSKDENREFTPLVTTNSYSGYVDYQDTLDFQQLKPRDELQEEEVETSTEYVLAAHIREKPLQKKTSAEDEGGDDSSDSEQGGLNVVLVTDMDVLHRFFFMLRGSSDLFQEQVANWQVDNVPFVLNVIDYIADEDRFMEIRKRRRVHRELTAVKRLMDQAKQDRNDARDKARKKFKDMIDEEEKTFEERVTALRARTDMDPQQKQTELQILQKSITDRINARKAKLDRERDDEYRVIENQMAAKIHRVQDNYKMLAVLLPPITPLIIAICVFFVRRSQEREGVQASRLVSS